MARLHRSLPTVLGTNSAAALGFDSGGPTFTVNGNFLGTDTLSLIVSGTVDVASGDFTANAAGIIIGPDPTNTGNHPGQTVPNLHNPTLNYAALLIGNSTLGFFLVFPSSVDFGLGNPNPPTTLSLTDRTLADIGFAACLSNSTVLELRVSDINAGDNSVHVNVPPCLTFGTSVLACGRVHLETLLTSDTRTSMRQTVDHRLAQPHQPHHQHHQPHH
jgi:hypothetical protein